MKVWLTPVTDDGNEKELLFEAIERIEIYPPSPMGYPRAECGVRIKRAGLGAEWFDVVHVSVED